MIIFVSHKNSDSAKAAEVAKTLRDGGHQVYLDLIDDGLKHGTQDLADYLRGRLGQCNSLIAVISSATQSSWWVPWEIGVATERDYPLSSYLTDSATPPEYLKKWPILRSLSDLLQFFALVKSVETREKSLRLSESRSIADSKRIAAAEFHASLKSKLGQ